MPLAIALVLFGSSLVVAGWRGQNVIDVLLGRANAPRLPESSPADFGVGADAAGPVAGGIIGGLPNPGLVTFQGVRIASWIEHYLTYAVSHGWRGHVTSGYRTYAEQQAIYDEPGRTGPAAVPGTSNHEGYLYPRGAVDVTDAPELSAILSHYPGGSLLVWAGAQDPVHFSHPHNGSY